MILLLKDTLNDIVEAHAYLITDSRGGLDIECAAHKERKISPDIFPATVIKDRRKSIITVGYKDSELMYETFQFESKHLPHYGDIILWIAENQLRYLREGHKVFIWFKDTTGHVVSYAFHLDKFLMAMGQKTDKLFMRCTQKGRTPIYGVSLVKGDKLLHGKDILRKYDMN